MKKVLSIVLLCVFALAFVGGIAVSDTNAVPTKCAVTCIDHVLWICCPVGPSGELKCHWGTAC
jgi:hypothetical protein